MSPQKLHGQLRTKPGSITILTDEQLTELLGSLPNDPENEARVYAEAFARLWLYEERAPRELQDRMIQAAFDPEFLTQIQQCIKPLRRPPPAKVATDPTDLYNLILPRREREKYIWKYLAPRLIWFLDCDGYIALASGTESAVAIPFRFISSPSTPGIVRQSDVLGTPLIEWGRRLEALAEITGLDIGIQIDAEFPDGKAEGGSLGLAVLLARERMRAQTIDEFSPFDVLASGAFLQGNLKEVDAIPAKASLATRLGCKLFIAPRASGCECVLDLPPGLAFEQCLIQIAKRLAEEGLGLNNFHAVTAGLDRLERSIDKATFDEAEECALRLERYREALAKSEHPQSSAKLGRCDTLADSIENRVKRLREHDTIGFVHHYRPGDVPAGLQPHDGFCGRTLELEALAQLIQPAAIIPITGFSGSGKTALVAEALDRPFSVATLLQRTRGNREIAVLHVALKSAWGRNPVVRRLLYALGSEKRGSSGDQEEGTHFSLVRAELFFETLPARFGRRVPLVVIDDLERIAADKTANEDVLELLRLECLRRGTVLILSSAEFDEKGRALSSRQLPAPLRIRHLCVEDARAVLTAELSDAVLADAAVAILGADAEALLHPRALRDGARNFKSDINVRGVPESAERLAESVLEAATEQVMESMERAGCPWVQSLPQNIAPQLTLLAMATLAELQIALAEITAANLPPEYFQRLTSTGWLRGHGERALLPEIACSVLRRQIAAFAANKEPLELGQLAAAVSALVVATTAHASEEQIPAIQEALEEALAWAMRAGLAPENPIRTAVETALLPLVEDDVVFPFTSEEVASLKDRITAESGFTSALARLVMAAQTDVSNAVFLSAWQDALANAAETAALPSYQIRILDSLGRHGAVERRLFREVLDGRLQLLTRLETEAAMRASQDGALARSVASWFVNTAESAFGFGGERARIEQLATRAQEILETSPKAVRLHAVCAMHWIQSRLARLYADLATTADAAISALERSAEHAETAFFHDTAGLPRVQFYLRAVGRLLDVLVEATPREAWLRRVETSLERCFGGPFTFWPISAQAHFIALLREEAELHQDPEQRLACFVALESRMRSIWEAVHEMAKLGDSRPLLVVGRVYRQFAFAQMDIGHTGDAENVLTKARDIARFLLRHSPSPAAWRFRLSLLAVTGFARLISRWDFDLDEGATSTRDEIKETVRACKSWLETQNLHTLAHAYLQLECHQLMWRLEGSIIRVARFESESTGGDFFHLPFHLRCEKLESLAHRRQHVLGGIERAYGGFVALSLTRIHNEAQLLYSLALMRRDGEFDSAKIVRMFELANEQFPNSDLITAETARFFRRIWNYGESITRFEQVLARTRNAQMRREVSVDVVETLLIASIHCDAITLPDSSIMSRTEMLGRARAILETTFGGGHRAKDVAVLRDLVSVELNEPLDWALIESTYVKIVGGEEEYLHTIATNIVELRRATDDSIDHLADAARNDFTHANPLRALGKLFLRRAELGISVDPVRDLGRAYGCFNACRILEKAALGKETALSAFELARTIVTAVKISHSPQPFPTHPEDDGYSNLLTMAEAKLQSALDRSVGLFHTAVRDWQKKLQEVRRELFPKSVR